MPEERPAAPVPEAALPGRTIRRTTHLPDIPALRFTAVVEHTEALLERRFRTMSRLVDVASPDVNINPFLMLALAPAYNIFSPYEAAEYVQNGKLPHGDATAFGRFVETLFDIFGTEDPPEKAADPDVFSPIDRAIDVEGERVFMSLKAGPWTMNQPHANEMVRRFPEIHAQTGCRIVIGITYGKRGRVNNKPGYVMQRTGDYVHTLVGQELWEFVTGVEGAHLQVFQAIREAQRRFATAHGGKTFFEHMVEARLRLADSFRNAFDLVGAEDDMWERIFEGSF